ncbi:hypothetical protein [Streptacidiphilus jiangxiensis]|uniref:YcxB-like protein n=1 Tax=Streptacidiphilus jiangxiensis TaxID=235985 RepID=A0A1H7MSW8_STRJI|nr:hypothetical protein [Streptacidiphilus jiangxiensis]SEL14303.1 hypothetical protein SAMN05414137_10647 [Streptacidiphilus jiangxiensis]
MSALPIVTSFTSSPEMVLRSYRACHRSRYLNRLALMITCATVGLIEVAISLNGSFPVRWAGVALALWGVAFFAWRELSVRRQLAPYLKGSRQVTITLTETEYRTQGPDRATARTWTTFSSVTRVGDFWVLRLSPQAAMGLPVSALDEQQTAAFTALMREKGLCPA